MRVIGGALRGRRLEAPQGLAVRPTPDRVREALFDILGDRVRGVRFLDLFAGSGAVGIEAISRGAERAAFVENGAAARRALARNLETLGVLALGAVARTPWPEAVNEAARAAGPFTIVFADPPFTGAPYGRILESVAAPGVLAHEPIVILEHERRAGAPEEGGGLARDRIAAYGRVALAFYRLKTG